MYCSIVGPCLAPWLDFFFMTKPGIDVASSLIQLSTPFRRLHDFAADAVFDANFPIQRTIKALYFRGDLSQLEVLRVTHAGDQLLRLSLNGLNSSVLFKSTINESRFGCELLNQSCYHFLAIRVFVLDCWMRCPLHSLINVTATSLLVLRSASLFEMRATSLFVLRALFIRREYGSR